MGTHGVVVVLPRGDDVAGIVQIRELMLKQTFGAHLVVKVFDVLILDGLTRADERELHLASIRPRIKRPCD